MRTIRTITKFTASARDNADCGCNTKDCYAGYEVKLPDNRQVGMYVCPHGTAIVRIICMATVKRKPVRLLTSFMLHPDAADALIACANQIILDRLTKMRTADPARLQPKDVAP